jgi:hypothetical protein
MNKEQQRIAIAKACGWLFDHVRNDAMYYLPEKDFYVGDPLRDLNAMQEAEKILIRPNLYAVGGWGMYLRNLSIVTDEQHPIDATAAQRAEAFLRTIEKWTTPTQTEQTKL